MNNYPTGGNFSTGNNNRQELRYSMSYELSGRQLLKYNNNNNILKIIIQQESVVTGTNKWISIVESQYSEFTVYAM